MISNAAASLEFHQKGRLLGGAAFVIAVPTYLLSAATFGDIVQYYHWANPATVREPRLGQFYVIDENGTVKEPLCLLTDTDFEPQISPEPDRRLINRLGDSIPVAIDFAQRFIPMLRADSGEDTAGEGRHVLELRDIDRRYLPSSSLLDLNRRILASRDLDAMEKDMPAAEFGNELRLESCARAVQSNVESNLLVCQVNDVVRLGSDGPVLGVDFAALCIARSTDTKPRRLPKLDRGSLLSRLKNGLGLLDIQFLAEAPGPDRT